MTPTFKAALDKAKGKLNVQGLARRSPELMTAIMADEGDTTVSIDLAAGEPTVTSHFSRDRNYLYACFDGVGKVPEYRGGVLMIDDIYLMTTSVSPIGKKIMNDAWTKKWPAGSFQDQWMADPEVIKSALKKTRQQHKILALGLGYGMGPKKMSKQAYDFGFELTVRDAKVFHNAYWTLFNDVKKLGDKLATKVERDGYLINPFGYRLTPSPFKSLNFFIQSSVSGLLHVFTAKLMSAAPWAKYSTLIHDELLIDTPKDRLAEFRQAKDAATKSLNDDLKWTVNIRTGFVDGLDWYAAK